MNDHNVETIILEMPTNEDHQTRQWKCFCVKQGCKELVLPIPEPIRPVDLMNDGGLTSVSCTINKFIDSGKREVISCCKVFVLHE